MGARSVNLHPTGTTFADERLTMDNTSTAIRRPPTGARIRKTTLNSLIFGTVSSTVTTVAYQPLELLKTRIQLTRATDSSQSADRKVTGRATRSAIRLCRENGFTALWRGTGASLLRSGPGVGLYYASLNLLQEHFSHDTSKPNSPTQAFCFGLTARSLVSLLLLPVTVIKVRYESGKFVYPSLGGALRDAYLRSGWTGIGPTILRDSLFSGTYYMCYTKLKSFDSDDLNTNDVQYSRKFVQGVVSGLIASLVTNPIDVVKTNIQVVADERVTVRQVVALFMGQTGGYKRFFDGLVPRSLRRTLVAATTWTLYELMTDKLTE